SAGRGHRDGARRRARWAAAAGRVSLGGLLDAGRRGRGGMAEQAFGDEVVLHFGGAGVEAAGHGIAPGAFVIEVAQVAGGAVEVDGEFGGAAEAFAEVELGHAGLEGGGEVL